MGVPGATATGGGRHVYLSLFDSAETAAAAYDAAVVRLRGAQAVTNFPIALYAAELKQHAAAAALSAPRRDASKANKGKQARALRMHLLLMAATQRGVITGQRGSGQVVPLSAGGVKRQSVRRVREDRRAAER